MPQQTTSLYANAYNVLSVPENYAIVVRHGIFGRYPREVRYTLFAFSTYSRNHDDNSPIPYGLLCV